MIRTQNTARALPSDTRIADEPTRPLASWYAQGRSDGFGDRLLMFDNTGAPSLELLRFRSDLGTSPAFERALRERVERLTYFRHPVFPSVRAVEHLENGEGLTLVSTYTPGKRLSEMFEGTRPRAGLHPAFAVWLIRELTSALADLQRLGPAVAHSALSLDRIVLAPDGALVITEQVLGSGLRGLGLTPDHLWTRFALLAPSPDVGGPRLDHQTDIVQLALVAMSVLLGRRITPIDYPQNLDVLLDESRQISERRSPSLAPRLCRWFEQALRLDHGAFSSAEQARDGLRELPDYPAPARIERPRSIHLLDAVRSSAQPDAADVEPSTPNIASTGDAPATQTSGPETDEAIERTAMNEIAADAVPSRRFLNPQTAAMGLALLAVIEGAVIIGLYNRPVVSPVGAFPMAIESAQPGEVVMIDGRQAGVTPLTVNLAGDAHSVVVLTRPFVPAAPEIVPAPPESRTPSSSSAPDPKTAAALAQAAARQKSGGLRLTSPFELQILEGEQVLGSTANGPIVAAAGDHEFDLINSALGYRTRQKVTIKAGQIISLTVTPPDGRLSINASPWAQVWIDGRAAGETPLANVSVPAGEHEITFRHPQLGERRQTALVKAGSLTRVSATLGR